MTFISVKKKITVHTQYLINIDNNENITKVLLMMNSFSKLKEK